MKVNYSLVKKSLPSKVLLAFFCLLFVITPFAQILAEETAPSPSPAPDAVVSDSKTPVTPTLLSTESLVTPPVKTDGVSSLAVPSEIPQNLSAQSTTDTNRYNNSNFVYQKTALPEANASSGALSYSYPIVTPSGRAGIEPTLKISYNSSDNSNINIAGYGWDLNIPSIERVNRQGNLAMYTEDYFSSSFSGELASTTESAVYRARVDSGEFLKYVYNATTTSWRVYDKQGRIYTFGSVATSRNADPANASRVVKWFLDEVSDSNGNYISYNYTALGGQVYLTEITYTNHQASSGEIATGIYKVTFNYEDARPDSSVTSYRLGFLSTNAKRLRTIEVRVSDILKKKYDLVYSLGVNGVRSLLSSVTETGYDSQGVATVLPQTTFEYTKGFENPALPAGLDPANSSGWFTYALGYLFYGPERRGDVYADLNGDGYLDSFILGINPYDSSLFSSQVTWNRLGTSGSSDLPYLIFAHRNRGPNSSSPEDTGARVADFNGDGFNDFVGWPVTLYDGGSCTSFTCPPPPKPKTLYLNTRSNNQTSEYTYTATTTALGVGRGNFMADFDGSGVPKIDGRNPNYIGAMDVNADGLDDMKINDGDTSFEITGSAVAGTPASRVSTPLQMTDDYGNDMGVRFIDINGDGLVDILRGWILPAIPNFENGYTTGDYNEVYLNTGSGFVKSAALRSPYFIRINSWNWKWFFTYTMIDYYDTNGDGLADIPNGPTTKADLLRVINYPQGGQTMIDYKTTAGGTRLNPKLPTILWIVSQMTTTDGVNGEPQVDTYTYSDGQGFFNNSYDKKFAGFGKVTKTSGTTVAISYFHQGNGDNATTGETADSYGKIGSAYKTEIFDKDGKLFARTQNVYGETPLVGAKSQGFTSSAPVFVYLSKKIDESFDGTANHRDRATEFTYDASNGNLLSSTDYGEVTTVSTNTLSSPTFSDVGNDKVATNYTYASFALMFQTASQNTVDQNSNKIKELRYYYDNLPLGQVAKGNVTKQESLISSGRYSVTSATYNPFALVATTTDANLNATSYLYDTLNLYPISITNSLHQTTQYEYDYAFGKPTKITDSNNQIYAKTYDAFGRLLSEKQPDGNATVSAGSSAPSLPKTSYQYTDTPNNVSVKQTDFIDASLSRESDIYFDGFGREAQTRKQSEKPSVFESVDTLYDSQGQVAKQSVSYFSDGSGRTSATGDSTLYTSFVYDALGRNTQKTDALGTTNMEYNLGQTKITDSLGKSKVYYKDVFGRLIRVDELNASETYSTLYEYDALGNLLKITDALGNVRNFTYDALGRRISAEDLHSRADTTFGSYAYAYDDAGNLTQVVDPNNNIINYAYDGLNRQLLEKLGTVTKVTNTYDEGLNGIGRLTGIATDALTQTNTYNPSGGLKSQSKIINAVTYATSYDYDRQGNQTSITNPDNSQIKYIYSSAGLLNQVQRKESADPSFVDVVTNFDYSPTEQPTIISYANGIVTTNTYDSTKLYRLTNKVSLKDAIHLQDLSYTYDNVGNITKIADASNTDTAKTADYAYDDLYRLTSATITNVATGQTPYTENYAYDAIGNILSKTEGFMPTSVANQSLDLEKDGSQYAYTSSNFGIVGGPATIELWFKPESTPSNETMYLAQLMETTGNTDLSLRYWNSGATTCLTALRDSRFGLLGEANWCVPLTNGEWYHIVLWYDGTTVKLFTATAGSAHTKRAEAGVSGTSARAQLQNGFYIGSHPLINSMADGEIDDVRVWNKAMSLPQLDGYFENELAGNETNLVGYYKLNNNWNDSTAGGHTLTPVNSPVFDAVNFPFIPLVGTTTTYAYAGTNYANPHAVTSIGSTNFTYDNNGNELTKGSSLTNTWDYNNRLITSVISGASATTMTSAYDPGGQRVSYSTNPSTGSGPSATTYYPSKYFNKDNSGKVAKHIFGNGLMLATISQSSGGVTNSSCAPPATGDWTISTSCVFTGTAIAPASVIVNAGKVLTITANSKLLLDLKRFKLLIKKGGGVLVKKGGAIRQIKITDTTQVPSLTYHLADHLNSITLSTNSQGIITELSDYYPYGSIRVDEKSGSLTEQRKFIGQEYDTQSGLSYLNARYYDGARGQFLNQDREFWTTSQSWLTDPQNQNSYSYARDNPINLSDPSGRCAGPLLFACIYAAITLEPYLPAITTGVEAAYVGTLGYLSAKMVTGSASQSDIDTAGSLVTIGSMGSSGGGSSVASGYKLQGDLRYSQTSANYYFDSKGVFSGQSIGSKVADLHTGVADVSSIPVNYVQSGSVKLLENTRSAVSLQAAGIPPSKWNLKPVSFNSAEGQRVQDHLVDTRNNLTPAGTNVITVTNKPTNSILNSIISGLGAIKSWFKQSFQ